MGGLLKGWSERGAALWARAPRGQFWVYLCGGLFFSFGFSVYFFLFNVYLLHFGYDERSLGLIGSCAAMGGLCGTIPAGMLAERIGLRWTLTLNLVVAVIACGLRVCIPWEPAQLVLAAVAGIALSANAVCLSPAVASMTSEEQRPFAFSLIFASGIGDAGLGSMVAGRLPGWFASLARTSLTAMQSERAVLIMACLIAGIAVVPYSWLTLQSSAPRGRMIRPSTPFLRHFLPAMTVWAVATGAFPQFANVYFVHHLGMSLRTMGSVFSVSQAMQLIAILIVPLLSQRLGLTAGVMLTQLATGALLLSLAAAHTPAQAGWIYCGYMAAQCSNEPGIYSMLMARVPVADRSTASAYTFFVTAGAQAIASSVVGAAIVRFGYSAVLCGIAGLAIVAAGLFRRLHRASTAMEPVTAE